MQNIPDWEQIQQRASSEIPKFYRYLLLQYRFLKRRVYRLLGIKGRSAWISAPQNYGYFAGAAHPESPARLYVIEQSLREADLWRHLQKIDAPEVSDLRLARVHTRNYLNMLESSAPDDGSCVKISEDTYLSRDTWLAARYAAGAVVKAVDMVMNRQAKNAFCAIRPPGHHAASTQANGFCFLNNVAIGAMHAIAEYRLQRVAIIDFDLHHGDGTEEIFRDDERVMLLSSFEHPLYPFSGTDFSGSNPNIVNSPLKAGDGSREFRDIVRNDWLPRLAAFKPEIILISAGFDGHRDDPIGHLNLDEADYEWLTNKLMLIANRYSEGRVVSVLEGGYNLSSLASSAQAHIGRLLKASRIF